MPYEPIHSWKTVYEINDLIKEIKGKDRVSVSHVVPPFGWRPTFIWEFQLSFSYQMKAYKHDYFAIDHSCVPWNHVLQNPTAANTPG
jgi:hypothetical protein